LETSVSHLRLAATANHDQQRDRKMLARALDALKSAGIELPNTWTTSAPATIDPSFADECDAILCEMEAATGESEEARHEVMKADSPEAEERAAWRLHEATRRRRRSIELLRDLVQNISQTGEKDTPRQQNLWV